MTYKKESLIKYWEKFGVVKNKRVLEAFRKINREDFVLENWKSEAYEDYPLPIPKGQTISQPTTVVIMLDALELQEGNKVLEVGSGSGYNAALMGWIAGEKGRVISTEIIPELATFASENIKKTGLKNVRIILTDGSQGYQAEAPYDRIIVTAASPRIPKVLVRQLKNNGVIILPVGPSYGQEMLKGRKIGAELLTQNLGAFTFVPLKGKYGQEF